METYEMAQKESFISDKRRISYLSAIYNRIYRGQSVLIEGDYGVGKTRFLNLLRPKKLHAVRVESLFNIHVTLALILKQLNLLQIIIFLFLTRQFLNLLDLK